MNRLIYLFVAVLAMALASCSPADPVDKAVGILEKASSRVEKASTEDEAMKITSETAEELKALHLNEQKLTASEQARLTKAIMDFMQACMNSKIDFTKGSEVLDLSTPTSEPASKPTPLQGNTSDEAPEDELPSE